MLTNFVALYRGDTVESARLVAVTADREVVQAVAERLLEIEARPTDPVEEAAAKGKRRALQIVRDEASATGREP